MTIEQQREAMTSARTSATAEASECCQAVVAHPCFRVDPLGQDREDHLVWKLPGSSTVLTGDSLGALVLFGRREHQIWTLLQCMSEGSRMGIISAGQPILNRH